MLASKNLREIKNLTMKKQFKKIVLGLLGFIIIIAVLLGIYLLMAQNEIKSMHPLKSQEIGHDLFVLQDSFVNMYLLKDGEEYIAIDAGNDQSHIQGELEKLSIDPLKVKAVLLTHSDGDHTAALGLFENAAIFLSKAEEALINGESPRFLFFGNSLKTEHYLVLEDQEELNLNNTQIKCFLVPGHTPGSMCFLIDHKYLFVGDAMGIENNAIVPFNSFFNMDSEQALASMKIIQDIENAPTIYTAHHGSLSIIDKN